MSEPTEQPQPQPRQRLDDVDLDDLMHWLAVNEPDSATARLVDRALAELVERRAADAATTLAEPVAWLWRRAAGDDGVRKVMDVNDARVLSTTQIGETAVYPARASAEHRARTWGGTVHALVEQTGREAAPGRTPVWPAGWTERIHDAVGDEEATAP